MKVRVIKKNPKGGWKVPEKACSPKVMLITLILTKSKSCKTNLKIRGNHYWIEQYWTCHSRVKRLQLQVRRLLRRLVAVRVKATDEINFKNKSRRQREMTSLHFPLNLRVIFTKLTSTEASNSIALSPAHLYNGVCVTWDSTETLWYIVFLGASVSLIHIYSFSVDSEEQTRATPPKQSSTRMSPVRSGSVFRQRSSKLSTR